MSEETKSTGEQGAKQALTAPAVSPSLLRQLGVSHTTTTTAHHTVTPAKKIEVKTVGDVETSVDVPPAPVVSPPAIPVLVPEKVVEDDTDDTYADERTDAAVDDIMHHESDALLGVQEISSGAGAVEPPHFKRHWLKRWFHNSPARWITFLLILAVIGTVAAIPTVRYWALNHAGVRASLSLTAIDGGTLLPLEGVTVQIGSEQATTDIHGVATVHHLLLGPQTVSIGRVAFATQRHTVVVGWGENPSGSFTLHSTGVRYSITATDYFSGKPIASAIATASDGSSETTADKTGMITLTLDTNGNATASATVSATGYLTVPVTLKPNTSNTVALVPSQKDVSITKVSGKYNVYTTDADGSNTQLLLAGTGLETSKLALATGPDNAYAAVVSIRDHTTDASGVVEPALTLVNTATGAATVLDHADQIKILGWTGTTVIYETAATATNTVNASRVKIIAYNYSTSTREQLVAANDLNAIVVAQNTVYYAVSSSDPNATAAFFAVTINGSDRQTILGDEVLAVYRTTYDTILLETNQAWYSYSIGSSAAPQTITAPTNYVNNLYVVSPDGAHAASIVSVNGTATLQITATSTGQTTNIPLSAAPTYPLQWLNNDALIFRSGGTILSDYGVSISGGTAKKITSVVSTAGFSVAP